MHDSAGRFVGLRGCGRDISDEMAEAVQDRAGNTSVLGFANFLEPHKAPFAAGEPDGGMNGESQKILSGNLEAWLAQGEKKRAAATKEAVS